MKKWLHRPHNSARKRFNCCRRLADVIMTYEGLSASTECRPLGGSTVRQSTQMTSDLSRASRPLEPIERFLQIDAIFVDRASDRFPSRSIAYKYTSWLGLRARLTWRHIFVITCNLANGNALWGSPWTLANVWFAWTLDATKICSSQHMVAQRTSNIARLTDQK